MIEINARELCTILCALRESAAAATELGLLAPAVQERRVLLANAEVFSSLANQLMLRQAQADDARQQRIGAHNSAAFGAALDAYLNEAPA